VRDNHQLTDQLFDQLVDLLFESLLLDLGDQVTRGVLALDAYLVQLAELAAQGRAAGLFNDT
jgi:hypothetical protein